MTTTTELNFPIMEPLIPWFDNFAQTEKQEIELLLSKKENVEILNRLDDIFTLNEDKLAMIDIINGKDILQNAIKIALRSIENGNNLETHIINHMPTDYAKYAFLILKRHLILYSEIEHSKDKSFFKDSDYKSIYGFCKVFSVPNKLSVLLKVYLGIKSMEEWLGFDPESNKVLIDCFGEMGVTRFKDVCLLLNDVKSYKNILTKVRNNRSLKDDKRLEFKILHLKRTIDSFKWSWNFINF